MASGVIKADFAGLQRVSSTFAAGGSVLEHESLHALGDLARSVQPIPPLSVGEALTHLQHGLDLSTRDLIDAIELLAKAVQVSADALRSTDSATMRTEG